MSQMNNFINRSIYPSAFCTKVVPNNSAKFTGKDLNQGLFSITLQAETLYQKTLYQKKDSETLYQKRDSGTGVSL